MSDTAKLHNCVVDGGEHCLHWPVSDIDERTGVVIWNSRATVYCCHCDLDAWREAKDAKDADE